MTDRGRSDSATGHPLDVFDELLDMWESAESYVIQDSPGYEPQHITDLAQEKKVWRDAMEAALDWYAKQARLE